MLLPRSLLNVQLISLHFSLSGYQVTLILTLSTFTMTSKHTTNGDGEPQQGLGQEFTDHVINSWGPKTDPRLQQIMASFVQHIHDFARDVDLTVDEWMAGVQMINQAGQMSNDRRNEGQLLCDVIGLES